MSDFERLKTMLRNAARDGMAPRDRVKYETGRAGVAHILEELGTAVLGQRLSFEFEDGARIVCEASGRRLVRLLTPAPARLTPEQVALFDRDDLAGEDAQGLADLLVGLCERNSGFAVTAQPLGDEIGPAHGGVAPAAIAEAAGLSGDTPVETGNDPSHQAFLDALGPSLQAAVLVEDEAASLICGEGDEAAFIVDWADSSLDKLLTAGFPLLGTLETNGILVFSLPETQDRDLLIAGRRGSLVIATVTGGHLVETLDRWRALNLAPVY